MSHLVRLAKFLVPVLIVVEAALVLSGVTTIGEAAMIVVATELLLMWLIIVEIVEIRRAYRRFVHEEPDRFTAAMRALETVLPKPMGKLLRHELMLQRALVLFILRKRDVPPGGRAIAYHRPLMTLMGIVFGVTLVEILVVELAVPWPTVRWILLLFSIIGCLWFAGFTASLTVYPLAVGPDTVRIRFSSFVDISVPLDAVDRVVPHMKSRSQRRTAMFHGDALVVEVSGSSNTVLYLREPVPLRLERGGCRAVREIHVWADNPRDLINAVEESR